MRTQVTEYKELLPTGQDRIVTRFKRSGKQVVEYSVQYEALIASRWRVVERFDNFHGASHRHVYRADKKKYWFPFPYSDNNKALTEAQKLIKSSFQKMKDNYLMTGKKG